MGRTKVPPTTTTIAQGSEGNFWASHSGKLTGLVGKGRTGLKIPGDLTNSSQRPWPGANRDSKTQAANGGKAGANLFGANPFFGFFGTAANGGAPPGFLGLFGPKTAQFPGISPGQQRFFSGGIPVPTAPFG